MGFRDVSQGFNEAFRNFKKKFEKEKEIINQTTLKKMEYTKLKTYTFIEFIDLL